MNHLLDLGSRKFWRMVGKPVDLTADHCWLTDHELRIWHTWVMCLHHKMEHAR